MFGVNSTRLRPVEEFQLDGVVTHGSWVGVVRQVVSNIHLKFPDGSACKIADRHADSLEDVNDTDKDPVYSSAFPPYLLEFAFNAG